MNDFRIFNEFKLLQTKHIYRDQQAGAGVVFEEFFQAKLLQATAEAGQGPGGERAHQLRKGDGGPEAAVEGERPRQAGELGGGGARPPQRQGPRRLRARIQGHHPDGLHTCSRKRIHF